MPATEPTNPNTREALIEFLKEWEPDEPEVRAKMADALLQRFDVILSQPA